MMANKCWDEWVRITCDICHKNPPRWSNGHTLLMCSGCKKKIEREGRCCVMQCKYCQGDMEPTGIGQKWLSCCNCSFTMIDPKYKEGDA